MVDNSLKHIAIIMDGNGRWAKSKNKARQEGHLAGVKKIRDVAIYANKLGVKCLTLYAFSTENWKRPQNEVNYIMSLPKFFFDSYIQELIDNNVKVQTIGDLTRIPKDTKKVIDKAINATKDNSGITINLAINYGSQDEIIRAIKKYSDDVLKGRDNDLNPDTFSEYLDTKGLPDIDLLIRTSGEKRISNFLLWQIAYSELIFVDTYWPDFSDDDLDNCIKEYYSRHRRLGGLDEDENN